MAQVLCQRCRRETESAAGEVDNPGAIEDLDLRVLPWVDMSEHMHLPMIGGVYFAVADRGMCYIGESENLNRRLSHHPLIQRFHLENAGRILWLEINDKPTRREYEKSAIRRFRPFWNRGGDEKQIGCSVKQFVRRELERRAQQSGEISIPG